MSAVNNRALTRNGTCDDTEWTAIDITAAGYTNSGVAILRAVNLKNTTVTGTPVPDPLPKIKYTADSEQGASTVITVEPNNGTLRVEFTRAEECTTFYLRSVSGSNTYEAVLEFEYL